MINVLLKPFENRLPESNRLERIWVQAKVNFLKRYYGSFGGVLWAFINPMVQFLVYYVVFGLIINSPDENRPLSLLLGLTIWGLVIEGAQQGITMLKQKRFIVENLQFSKVDLYVSATLSTLFSFAINMLIYLLFAILLKVEISWNILMFPILLINLIIFVNAVQLVLSVAYPIVKDVTHLWDKSKLALFWFSGVIYPFSIVPTPIKEILLAVNPLSGIFMNMKNVCAYNNPIDWYVFIWDFVYCGILLLAAIWINKRYFHRAVERL